MKLKYDENGLIPAIIQDYDTKAVLMMAYMNEESLEKTMETGKTWFYSRSRKQLWNKGETSGHFQHVRKIFYDCDEDTLLIQVKQEGNACHTGEYTCFYREMQNNFPETADPEIISKLVKIIKDRRQNPKEGSYTNYLLDKGIDKVLKKVGEETSEVIIAAKNPSKEELVYEIADLVYHMLVLMEIKDVTLEDIKKQLAERFGR